VTAPSVDQPTRFRLSRTAIVGGYAGFLVSGGIASLYGPAAPAFRRAFGVDEFTSGLPASIHPFVAVAGVLVWVWLSRRIRPGVLLAVGALGVGTGAAGVAVASGMLVVLAWVLGIGAGFGMLANGMNTVYPRDTSPRAAVTVARMHGAFGAGAVLLPFVLAATGYRTAFLVVAALALVAAPLMAGTPAPPIPPRTGHVPRPERAALVGFGALFACYVGVEAATATWLATYLEFRGWSAPAAARWTSAFWLLFTLGRLVFAPLLARHQPGRIVRSLLLVTVLALLAASLPPLAPVGLLVAGLTMAPVFPSGMVWLPRALPSAAGAVTVVIMSAMVGATLAPMAVGAIGSQLGLAAIPPALALLASAATALAVGVARRNGAG
jgi:MFS transporter, FHS family, glucose/mannose:H+ symporter